MQSRHQHEDRSNRSVRISIDLAAIRSNLATARRLSGGSKQFATIKADAYGHGAIAVAHALSPDISVNQNSELRKDARKTGQNLEDGRADGFAVVSVGEALELRQSGIKQPILILQGPQSKDACGEILRHDLWPVIHDLEQYEWYRKTDGVSSLSAWLKIDTGMGRLGVQPAQAGSILRSARAHGVGWRGMLTHFACADEVENPFTNEQIAVFNDIGNAHGLERSMANSAGVLAWPAARADWARPGLMLYGCNPLDRPLAEDVRLFPAMTVSAPLIAVKHLAKGASVGYARTWHCPEDMPVGYVALGYRDGLPRVLDSQAGVTIAGVRCPVIGRVSMDSIAVDLRHCRNVQSGALAEFWGKRASIDELAKAAGTISYELLTSIRGSRQYTLKSG